MHRTRVEPIEVITIDDDERAPVIAYRVHCSCGYISPVPFLRQLAAADEAREHREMYVDAGVSEREVER